MEPKEAIASRYTDDNATELVVYHVLRSPECEVSTFSLGVSTAFALQSDTLCSVCKLATKITVWAQWRPNI